MKKLIVGISGATGAIYGIRLLEVLSKSDVETHLVITEAAQKTILMETSLKVGDVKSLAKVSYDIKNLGADISSGSFLSEGMVIIPCSIKSLSGIANSFNENLLDPGRRCHAQGTEKTRSGRPRNPVPSGPYRIDAPSKSNGRYLTPSCPCLLLLSKDH